MGEDGTAFFITEDIRDDGLFPIDGVEQIQEEKSYGSETVNERKISKQQLLPIEDGKADAAQEYQDDQREDDGSGQDAQRQFVPPESEGDEDVFDFGKAKMEFFKQRSRQILIDA